MSPRTLPLYGLRLLPALSTQEGSGKTRVPFSSVAQSLPTPIEHPWSAPLLPHNQAAPPLTSRAQGPTHLKSPPIKQSLRRHLLKTQSFSLA